MYLGYNVEYDDLVSYGIFGLIDAIDKFDLGKEVKFETYASLRIRGTILDQIRKWTGFQELSDRNRKRSMRRSNRLKCVPEKMLLTRRSHRN